jgi:hypothetical protein
MPAPVRDIVRGKGHPQSFASCSHGAGRAMSRGEAKRRSKLEDHRAGTEGVKCREDSGVIDDTPAAYEDIDAVMAAQQDLVEVVHTLKQVVCDKGWPARAGSRGVRASGRTLLLAGRYCGRDTQMNVRVVSPRSASGPAARPISPLLSSRVTAMSRPCAAQVLVASATASLRASIALFGPKLASAVTV